MTNSGFGVITNFKVQKFFNGRIKKPLILLAVVTGVFLFAISSADAASVGVNFLGDSWNGSVQRWQLAPADAAGVLVQTNWNNLATTASHNVGLSDLLLDGTGNYTALQLRFVANDAWESDGGFGTANEKLMHGILKEGNGIVGSTMLLSFTNLVPGLYDVYVYGNVNDGPVDLDVSIGGATNYWTEPATFDEATGFIEAVGANPVNRAAGNYVKFTGVTPVTGAITILATYQAGGDGLGIAGLQLVTTGSFPSNTVPVRIDRQPESTLGAPGSTATFLVWASGPGPRYQWFKNGALIAGATRSSYTAPTLHRTDDGSKYKVTVHNNVNTVTSAEAVLTVVDDPGTRIASLGASLLGDASDRNVESWRLTRAETAGVLAQTNWNNIATILSGNVGSSEPLLDGASHCTAVQLAFAANNAWNSDTAFSTANEKLMKGILKQQDEGSSLLLTFTNLAPAFYDVYVYGNVNLGPVDLDVSIEPRTNYWTEPAAFDEVAGFIQAASSNPNNRAAGNYTKFTGVTPASGTITLIATYQAGGDGLGIAGVQIAASAAFPTNYAPVVIRRQPRANIAAPGSAATFLVWAEGPFASYQWSKNGVALAGATSSAYTTPPVSLGDQGAQYRVTVANNVNTLTSDVAVLTVTNDPGTRVASLGVSFLGIAANGDVEPWRLAPAEVAGVIAQAHWSNLQWDAWANSESSAAGYVGLSGPLPDSAGNLTAVQLWANSNDAWESDGPVDSPNARLMKGILKQGEMGTSMTLIVSNLWAAFHDVYVYGNVNDGPAFLDVSIGSATNYWTELAAFDDSTGFVEATSFDPNSRGYGNYVKFTGVTPANGLLTITATYQGGSDGLGIAGVQLVSSTAFPPVGSLPPRLAAVAHGGQLVLSWSSPASFQLQSCADLTQASWTADITPPVTILDQHTVALPLSGPNRFFRLVGR